LNQDVDITSPMNTTERRASLSLAGIFALRMLGLFMVLPVFSIYAESLENVTPLLIGFAISAYGLTQALFQIPFGMLSDRVGRKPVIAGGLVIFALGSVVAAMSDSIYGVIFGRAIQGGGAIAAAVMAMAADLTREVHRTKAMATIGISIGLSFAVSLVLGPLVAGSFGLSGIFWITAVLALIGIAVLFGLVPNPTNTRFHRDTEALPSQFGTVLRESELLRLDFGILTLHMILTGSFVVLPLSLRNTSLPVNEHWSVYLPVLLVSMLVIVPFIILAEKKRKIKTVFLGAIAVLAVAQVGFLFYHQTVFGITCFLILFFCGFNLLEATLPSMISKIAPANLKGTAMGVYSTSQFLGAFLGGIGGGFLLGAFGVDGVFAGCLVFALLWLAVAFPMQSPRYLSNLLLNVGDLQQCEADLMTRRLSEIDGVAEAVVLADDGVAYLKVDKKLLDYECLRRLIPQAEGLS